MMKLFDSQSKQRMMHDERRVQELRDKSKKDIQESNEMFEQRRMAEKQQFMQNWEVLRV